VKSPRGTEVALYLSSEGNYFFREIRDLFAAAFEELGCAARFRDERKGFSRTARVHFVVAPHEFFYLGRGKALRGRAFPPSTVLYSTEQIDSEWFGLSQKLFNKAAAVWEIDRQTARHISAQGYLCHYVPIGYARGSGLFSLVRTLPPHYRTACLEPAALTRPRWGEPLAARPIDVFYAGNQTTRRERFFSRGAPVFSRFRTYFHFTMPEAPIQDGSSRDLDTRLSIGLVQRSKIVLNIHRSQARYFEWQRMVLQGIGQKALVISEPVTDCAPLRPNKDFLEVPLNEIPGVVDHLLSSAQGRREAQAVADRGFRRLKENCRLAGFVRPALRELLKNEKRRGRQPVERSLIEIFSSKSPVPVRTKTLLRKAGPGPAPAATVAVTLHNYRDYIVECLDSVRRQTARALDLVVVDDGSSDGSHDLVKRWLDRNGGRFRDFRLIRHEAIGGLALARNSGFEAARTPFVFVLDADNLLYPRCLERLTDALERSGAYFAYSYLNKFGEDDGLMNAKAWQAAGFRNGNYIDAMSLMRREVWEGLGGYRSHGVQGWEDFDFWLRLARVGGWGLQVPEILASYRVHLRSMLHRETNPNAEKLQRYFSFAFGVDFPGQEGPVPPRARNGSHQPPAPDAGPASAAPDPRRMGALSMLLERRRTGL